MQVYAFNRCRETDLSKVELILEEFGFNEDRRAGILRRWIRSPRKDEDSTLNIKYRYHSKYPLLITSDPAVDYRENKEIKLLLQRLLIATGAPSIHGPVEERIDLEPWFGKRDYLND